MFSLPALTGISSNVNTVIATLPEGYRPMIDIAYDIFPNTTPGVRMTISSSTGQIAIYNYTTNTGNLNLRCTATYIAG